MNKKPEIQKLYPLSRMQEGMLFHTLMGEDSSTYFEQICFMLHGEMDVALLEQSFNLLIARHDIFRTNFVHEKVKQPLQVVFKEKTAKVDFQDITGLQEKDKKEFIENFKVKDRERGFDLVKDTLVRLALIKMEDRVYQVLWSHHHMLLDGWCLGIVIKEFLDTYVSLREGSTLKLGKVYPYSEYIQWLQKQDREEASLYWKKYLAAYEEKVEVPRLKTKSKNNGYKREEIVFKIYGELQQALVEFAGQNQVTLNNVFQSIWGVLLQKYNRVEDVVFGAVVSGRPSEIEGIENMVGLFINTVPVRIACGGNMSFRELVGKVQEAALESAKYDHVPLAEVQANTSLKQNLIDHIIAFENYPLDREWKVWGNTPEGSFYLSDVEAFEQTNYDFNIIVETGSEIIVRFDYNSLLYDESFIRAVEGHLKNLMEKVTKEPDSRIDTIEIVTEQEKQHLLFDLNNTKAQYPSDMTLHALFERQVEKTPDRVALTFENQSITYRELNEKANCIAGILRSKGVKPDSIVGLMVERSIEMVLGILGILKSGGVYLPIDLIYPEERISYILEDSGTVLLLTQNHLQDSIRFRGETICLDDARLYAGAATNPVHVNKPSDTAYIIYTSGTTGKPKGVMIEHRNVVRLMFNDKFQFEFDDRDVWTMFHSVCFDFSVWEMYGALLYGGRLVVIPKLTAQDTREYLKVLKEEKVTVLNQTPSAFYNLMKEETGLAGRALNLRYVIFGGEALKPSLLKRFREKYPHTKLINMYGITETTVHVTFKEITEEVIEAEISNIGRPIPTLTTYILDKNSKLLPVGVAGELCVGGDGVGRGYLNRPELTAEKFIWNPYVQNERLYRSGDLARLLSNGEMEYLGRIDHQVKIRGFRIELGEIEASLRKHPFVKDALVLQKEDGTGDKCLCAYVVAERIDLLKTDVKKSELDVLEGIVPEDWPKIKQLVIEVHNIDGQLEKIRKRLEGYGFTVSVDGEGSLNNVELYMIYAVRAGEMQASAEGVPVKPQAAEVEILSSETLRSFLKETLPDYMVPPYFVMLEKFPLTANGKVDRRALPDPDKSSGAGVNYVSPSNETEGRLLALWQEILEIREIGVMHNFFDVGGHSLKATLLVSRIHKEFDVNIPLKEVFEYPTIHDLAGRIIDRDKKSYESIVPVATEGKEDPLPFREFAVSPAQKRLFTLYQLEGPSTTYNLPGVMLVEGSLDRQKLEDAFRVLIDRHEALRTSFEVTDQGHLQRIHKKVDFKIDFAAGEQEQAETGIREFVRPFDLAKAPLLRVKLLEAAKDRYFLLLDMHHSISDGVSIGILIRELAYAYQGKRLPELRIQYKDYSHWQNKLLVSESMKKQEEYWLSVFKNEIPVLNMPVDHPRPSIQSFAGDRITFGASKELKQKLNRFALETGTTLYMLLLAAYNVLLAKYTAQEDIVIGSPVAGRPHTDLQNTIGMFVNTLAMRSFPAGHKKFSDFLAEVKQNAIAAFEHQDYPFEQLVEKLEIRRDTSRNPVFDAMFGIQNMDKFELKIPGLTFKDYPFHRDISKVDLTLTAEEKEDGIDFEMEYAVKLFERETIERMAELYVNLLEHVAENREIQLSQAVLPSEKEKKRLLGNWNDTTSPYPREKTLKELFEEQAEKTPENTALLFGQRQMTYRQLNRKANQLAGTLRSKGVKTNSVVAMIMDRSVEMMVGLLGVLKAGGAYMPIDPGFPPERIQYMVEDSGAKILLTQKHLEGRIDFTGEILYVEDEEAYCKEEENLETRHTSRDLAYLMYTSGSTGKPKGNLTTQYNISRVVKCPNYIDITESDVLLQLSNYAFDGSTFDIFGALLNGAKLVMINKETLQDVDKLSRLIREERISIFFVTTALFNTLVDLHIECFTNIRKVLFGGERVSVRHVRKALEYMGAQRILHVYGPTESTVFATYYPVDQIEENPITIPIGKPLANTKVYILDKHSNLQPVGIPGELCIAGDGLVKGYLHRPELDAEKFVPDPFTQGQILYRTGDLARWLPEGNIEFIDRIDGQVKIRGFRIELGEIEYQLLKQAKVKEGIVTAREDVPGDKYICAYIVAEPGLRVTELKAELSRELPHYMIPRYFIQLEKMPLNVNGKVEKKQLPAPDILRTEAECEYAAPRNAVEENLLEIWKQVLGVHALGIHDNFFDQGGDSIKAGQVTSHLRKHGLTVEVKELFQYATIGELSSYVKAAERKAEQGMVQGEIMLTPIQKWFFEQNFTHMHHFNQAVMLYSKIGFTEQKVAAAFWKIVEHHDALRMTYRVEESRIVQWNWPVGEKLFDLKVVDLSGDPGYAGKIEAEVDRIQGGISLSTGPLVKLGLFKTEEGDHLLIVVHHLVIDGVSWRVLLEDFASAYSQANGGNTALQLQEKTGSFKEWSEGLQDYANSKELLQEIPYWAKIEENSIIPMLREEIVLENRLKDSDTLSENLSDAETGKLLKGTNGAYGTEITEILLAALGLTVRSWSGQEKALINLEGHGRENLMKAMEITRTVGWFTSAYPVVLDVGRGQDIPTVIKAVKNNIRSIPKKGVGYGILKYITLPENRKPLKFSLTPEISFNYLGQFDQDFKTKIFAMSPLSLGKMISPYSERKYLLDINAVVLNGELSISINYNKEELSEKTAKVLIQGYKENLLAIIEHCLTLQKERATLEALSGRSPEEESGKDGDISSIAGAFEKETSKFEHKFLSDLLKGKVIKQYPATGTQKYHLIEPELAGVVVPLGGGLELGILEKSLLQLIKTHELLRSVMTEAGEEIVWEEYECPSRLRIPFLDLSEYNAAAREGILGTVMSDYYYYKAYEKYKILHYRILLVKQTEDRYLLLLPFNHTIFDATSSEIIKQDLLSYYQCYKNQKGIPQIEKRIYSDYVNQVRKGPQGLSVQELVGKFHLQEAMPHLQRINEIIAARCVTEESTWFEFSIPMDKVDEASEANRPWQISFALLNAFCRSYLGVTKIPIRMVSNGRRMENNSYYNCVGDFADHVPMLIDNEGMDPVALATYVQDKINLAARCNINFADLLFDEKIRREYETVYPLVNEQLFHSPVLFNYQGKFKEEEIETFNNLLIKNNFDQYKKMIWERRWVAFFVKYSDEAMNMIIALPYKEDEEKLREFVNSEYKSILGTLTASL